MLLVHWVDGLLTLNCICQVQSFLTALRALSHKDFHYGSHATSEQVANMFFVCHEMPGFVLRHALHTGCSNTHVYCFGLYLTISCVCSGNCCWRYVRDMSREDACPHSFALQTYLLWRLCIWMVSHMPTCILLLAPHLWVQCDLSLLFWHLSVTLLS